MNFKSFMVIVGLFVSQMIISCETCSCDFMRYEVTYTGVALGAFDTAGFTNTPITSEAHSQSFGLEMSILLDQRRLARTNAPTFGFSQAFACDCVEPEYGTSDEIVGVTIIVQDVDTEQLFDVTDNFESVYYGKPSEIDFNEWYIGYAGNREKFQFDLILSDNIPTKVIFKVDVTLESGKVLTTSSGQILFLD